MKILEHTTRLSGSILWKNIFLVVVDYEDGGDTLYGKSIKDTIMSFDQLTKATNFNEHKKQIVCQMPFYSLDLIMYELGKLKKWILKKY